MANILEKVNQELVMGLHELQIKFSISELRLGQEKTTNQHLAICLKIAEDKIQFLEQYISDLKANCVKISSENFHLDQRNRGLKIQLEQAAQQISILYQAKEIKNEHNFLDSQDAPLKVKPQSAAMDIVAHPNPVKVPPLEHKPANIQNGSPEIDREHMKTKTSTIAMKLKLMDKNFATSPEVSKPKKVDSQESDDLRIFVGHLDSKIDEKSLKDYFGKIGEVTDVFIPTDPSGHNRGFAYVTFSRFFKEHPIKFNNHIINNRKVYVDKSHYEKDEGEPTETLLVSGLICSATDNDLKQHFSKYGEIVRITRSKDSKRKNSRWALIHFRNIESVDEALKIKVHKVNGAFLDCRRARKFANDDKAEPSKDHSRGVSKFSVRNLSFTTTTDTLKKHFSQYGTVVDAYIPTVYGTDSSKGFGYVVMSSVNTNFSYRNHLIDGRTVSVSLENFNNVCEKTTTLLVSAGPEIMTKVSEKDMKKFFSRFGKIISVRKPVDPVSKRASHYGFVEFDKSEAVDAAMGNLSYNIKGKIVCVTKSRYAPHK